MRCTVFITGLSLLLAAGPLLADASPEAGEEDDGGNFLVLPIIITEPAIGEGLGAVFAYFHADHHESERRIGSAQTVNRLDAKQHPPPTATGVFYARTNNETEAFGIGHTRSIKNDTWRLTAAVAEADVNATYYFADIPVGFSIEGGVGIAKLKRRLSTSNFFVGVSAQALNGDANFKVNLGIPDFEFTDVGAALTVSYDSRDDTMMPAEGTLIDLAYWSYGDYVGGDFDYTSATLKINSFNTLGENFVLGLRFEGSAANGDIPFYAQPFVSLRGIPALRYTGKTAAVVETELRYQFGKRWGVLAFGGLGETTPFNDFNQTEDDIWGYGVGFRYLALPKQNAWVGLDLARGPEDDAFYIQLVHPW